MSDKLNKKQIFVLVVLGGFIGMLLIPVIITILSGFGL